MPMSWARRLPPGSSRGACRSGASCGDGGQRARRRGLGPAGRGAPLAAPCGAHPAAGCLPTVALPCPPHPAATPSPFPTCCSTRGTSGARRRPTRAPSWAPGPASRPRWTLKSAGGLGGGGPAGCLFVCLVLGHWARRSRGARARCCLPGTAHRSPLPPPAPCLTRLIKTIGLERGLDTLVWQLIASVATPGYTIHCVVAAATWALAAAEASPGVLGGLHAAAAGLGMSNDAFVETFNKSVPTALGLLGERAARGAGCGRCPLAFPLALAAVPQLATSGKAPSTAGGCPPHRALTPLPLPTPLLQPFPSLCTPSTLACTPCSTPPCAPPCGATSAGRQAAARRGWPSATASGERDSRLQPLLCPIPCTNTPPAPLSFSQPLLTAVPRSFCTALSTVPPLLSAKHAKITVEYSQNDRC